MALSLQTILALEQLFGHGPAKELNDAINNALSGASPTFNAVTASSVAGGAISGATLALTGAAQLDGNLDLNAAAGAASSNTRITKQVTVSNNTDTAFFTITIPNILAGAVVHVRITGMLGDGDSTDSKEYLIAVSRIAGAAAKAVAGTAFGTAATVGASGNSVVTITVPSVSGGITAANTFAVTAKVARSAGTADNHIVTAEIQVLNASAGGVTVA